MVRPFLRLLVLAAASLCLLAVEASSSRRNPLSAIFIPNNITIHTHNQRVHALSEFDITFSIEPEHLIKLHLEPNHDILADNALVSYLGPDGTLRNTEPIDRLSHRVFRGTAWLQSTSDLSSDNSWDHVGWARVVVTQDGLHSLFEGAFAVNHDHHHIQISTRYSQTRHRLDPVVENTRDGDEYLIVWKDSDVLRLPLSTEKTFRRDADALRARYNQEMVPTCNSDQLSFNSDLQHPIYSGMRNRSLQSTPVGAMDFTHMFSKRQIDTITGGNSAGVNLTSTIGQATGCPSTRKVALVGVATDCTYTNEFNSTESTKANVIQQMNTASGIWEDTFNISLGLQNLVVSDPICPGTPLSSVEWNQACSDSVDIGDRLSLFSAWRGLQRDNNSHWTLLSTCGTGATVGIAWLGQACVQQSFTTNSSTTGGDGATSGLQTVSGANVVVRDSGVSEWQIIAHETGHTYGAVHDCTADACENAQFVSSQQCCPHSTGACSDSSQAFIMNPSASSGIMNFSPCSIGNICSAIGRNSVNSTCLTNNKEVTTYGGQTCGNGIVEPGEDCDCGGTAGCGNDKCCDPTTCKFTTGSVCDDASEDCCRNCQLASNGTVCRASTGFCDPQEVCSGTSATCPANSLISDGTTCGKGLQCTSGQCTSRNQQCKTAMGSYSQTNDTYACDETSCQLSCGSPKFGPNTCVNFNQNFLDGTQCEGDGYCRNGRCEGSSFGGEARLWISENKPLVIGLSVAVGCLVLAVLVCCIWSCCCRRRRRSKNIPTNIPPSPLPPMTTAHAAPTSSSAGWQGWSQAPMPPPSYSYLQPQQQQQAFQHPSHGWANPGAFDSMPPPAPRAYYA